MVCGHGALPGQAWVSGGHGERPEKIKGLIQERLGILIEKMRDVCEESFSSYGASGDAAFAPLYSVADKIELQPCLRPVEPCEALYSYRVAGLAGCKRKCQEIT